MKIVRASNNVYTGSGRELVNSAEVGTTWRLIDCKTIFLIVSGSNTHNKLVNLAANKLIHDTIPIMEEQQNWVAVSATVVVDE